jgi:hypothetical protein
MQTLADAVNQLDTLQPIAVLARLIVSDVLHTLPDALFRFVQCRDSREA